MLSKEKIERINALARKKKREGLTPEEEIEQKNLRKEYLADFRRMMEMTLERVTVYDPLGNDVTPEAVKIKKKKFMQ
ncbi:DUF896 domain-containing protein [Caldibacillus debilis]|mgnify:CR=1 FL=1|jgi:uncharacterized protein YnzC (UPF0291/DUF896 family)|uniref:UPF0291 protein Cdeb_02386 n=2 Tax=Caldibacillus debilis TaxID=301148 RepID=A0A420VK06_9BACI|nr:DUF896 domain-containing protein [Caldibacillus debilis]KYD20544.1 hypothetical protein B4135_1845 [Caldibacillus debilis]MBO2481813.1 DUF896 family protein [Bacillaceae bacterium]RKO64011.1 hypothetical protein Cdeb_02386 [Caldibacillus debilis GB1]